MDNKSNYFGGMGVLTAVSASLCCITPVLALLSGTSSIAASFSWIEPARPYLLVVTGLVLGIAWYQKLKPTPVKDDCGCEVPVKKSMMQTKWFLGSVTLFAILMSAFPYFSPIFYAKEINTEPALQMEQSENFSWITFEIEGMTCTGCEEHVKQVLSPLKGVKTCAVSYENGNAKVYFDSVQITQEALVEAINTTGYAVIDSVSGKLTTE